MIKYAADLNKHLIEHGTYVIHKPEYPTQDFEQKKNESWLKALKAFEGVVPKAKEKLEDEFRKMLG